MDELKTVLTHFQAASELKHYPSIEAMILDFHPQPMGATVQLEASSSQTVGPASQSKRALIREANGQCRRVFLKTCTAGSLSQSFQNMLRTFDKEIGFYAHLRQPLVASQSRNLTERPAISLDESLLEFFGAGFVGQDLHLVLSDLEAEGYQLTGRSEYHTLAQAHLAMRTLAAFHVASAAVSEANSLDWVQLQHEPNSLVRDYLTSSEFADRVDASIFSIPFLRNALWIKSVIQAQTAHHPLVPTSLRIPEGVTVSLMDQLIDMSPTVLSKLRDARVLSKGQRGVLAHGDFHMWNVAFSDKGTMKFFDFQVIMAGHPASDIHHYLSQSIPVDQRRANIQDLLKSYANAAKEECQRLGFQEDSPWPAFFNEDAVTKEYMNDRSYVGFCFGFCFILPRFIEDAAPFSNLSAQNQDHQEVVHQVVARNPSIWKPTQATLDILAEHLDMGTFGRLFQ